MNSHGSIVVLYIVWLSNFELIEIEYLSMNDYNNPSTFPFLTACTDIHVISRNFSDGSQSSWKVACGTRAY